MTTQEIKKYVSVADVWKKKYTDIKGSYDYLKRNSDFFEKELKETKELLLISKSQDDDTITEINSLKYEISLYQKKYHYMWIALGASNGLLILALFYWGVL